jgi:flagellar basal-body rod protein FlgC
VADALKSAITTSLAALRAQSVRLRVVSENLANANVTASTPGGTPYSRKTVSFKEAFDRASGASAVQVSAIGRDRSPFRIQHEPGHPAADAAGNVTLPNVNPLIELSDMREAHRSYEASLQIVRQSREMSNDLIDLLRGK